MLFQGVSVTNNAYAYLRYGGRNERKTSQRPLTFYILYKIRATDCLASTPGTGEQTYRPRPSHSRYSWFGRGVIVGYGSISFAHVSIPLDLDPCLLERGRGSQLLSLYNTIKKRILEMTPIKEKRFESFCT